MKLNYKVLRNPLGKSIFSYVVVNILNNEIQSSWPSYDEAQEVCHLLNHKKIIVLDNIRRAQKVFYARVK